MFDEKVTESKETINKHDTQLTLYKTKIDKLVTKTDSLEEQVNSNTENLSECSTKVNSMMNLKQKIDTFENQLRIDENYIEKYLPLYTQIQIADSIHSNLSGPSKKKHALYEQKKFQELIDNLRKENIPTNLARKIDRIFDAIDPTIKKYSEEYLGSKKSPLKSESKKYESL